MGVIEELNVKFNTEDIDNVIKIIDEEMERQRAEIRKTRRSIYIWLTFGIILSLSLAGDCIYDLYHQQHILFNTIILVFNIAILMFDAYLLGRNLET